MSLQARRSLESGARRTRSSLLHPLAARIVPWQDRAGGVVPGGASFRLSLWRRHSRCLLGFPAPPGALVVDKMRMNASAQNTVGGYAEAQARNRRLRTVMLVIIGSFASAFAWVLSVPEDPPRRRGHQDPCIMNLRLLEGAKAAWALDHGITNRSAMATMGELCGATNYIRGELTCPKGGVYRLGRLGERPMCTQAGHTL